MTHPLRLAGKALGEVVGFLLLAMGGIGLFGAIAKIHNGTQSAQWPSAAGRISASEVVLRGRTYHPIVAYEYEVNGRRYQGDCLGYGAKTLHDSKAQAEALLKPYPVGTHVDVYYKPASPGVSSLTAGMPRMSVALIGCGILVMMALGGGTMLYLSARSVNRQCAATREQPWQQGATAREAEQEVTTAPVAETSAPRRPDLDATLMTAGVIVLGLAVAAFWGGRYAARRAEQAAACPSTTGKVLSAEVRRVKAGRRSFARDAAFVKYAFSVDGRTYTSERLQILPAIQTAMGTAQVIVARYRPGSETEVFYNPSNPNEAILNNRVGALGKNLIAASNYALTVGVTLGIGLLAFGGMRCLTGLQEARRRDKARLASEEDELAKAMRRYVPM